jgi:hypothetical protein
VHLPRLLSCTHFLSRNAKRSEQQMETDELRKTCHYFLPHHVVSELFGSCRRYPPQCTSEFGAAFPSVSTQDWCGEHRRKRESETEVRP